MTPTRVVMRLRERDGCPKGGGEALASLTTGGVVVDGRRAEDTGDAGAAAAVCVFVSFALEPMHSGRGRSAAAAEHVLLSIWSAAKKWTTRECQTVTEVHQKRTVKRQIVMRSG